MEATIKQGLLIREIAGERILIDASGEVDFSHMTMLNDTAASIITYLQKAGHASAEDLAKHVADEYDVSYSEALADVEELLLKMEKEGIVKVRR